MTVIEYVAKFIELATYTHFLIANEHEKVRRFVDGIEHHYRGPVVRNALGGSYEEVVNTAFRYESYQERDMAEHESKRARSTDSFSGAPSRGKNGFNRWQSRPTQSKSVVQSSGRHIAKYRPNGNSSNSQGVIHPQGTAIVTQTQTQPARVAPQGACRHNRQGAQGVEEVGGLSIFFALTMQDAETSNIVVTCIITIHMVKDIKFVVSYALGITWKEINP
ncbi:uncharacterized protein [Nicotiana tomentosiformis]|uniref:uncharacterized protein n=1 Tax=Nicotiana tomentosiformis TaxID=4098 RepID=UPI00388C9B19